MRYLKLIFSVILAMTAAIAAFGQAPQESVPGELLVKFVTPANSAKAKAANQAVGAETAEQLGDLGWQRVKLPAGLSAVVRRRSACC